MICIRKALNHTVICESYRLMPPLICSLYDVPGLGNAVHITHLCMTVQFHSPFRRRIRTGSGKIGYGLDPRQRTNSQFMVEFIQCSYPFDLDISSRLQSAGQLIHLIVAHEDFYGHGIRKIRHIKHENRFFVPDLPFIQLQNLSPDNHLAHFADNIFDGDSILLKITSVDHIGIIGLLQRTRIFSSAAEFSLAEAAPACISPARISLSRKAFRTSERLLLTFALFFRPRLNLLPRHSLSGSVPVLERNNSNTFTSSIFSRCFILMSLILGCPHPTIYFVYLQLDLPLILFRKPACGGLPIVHSDPHLQAAPLHQYFFQHPHQLRFLTMIQNRVIDKKGHLFRIGIRNIRSSKRIVFYMTVFPQFCQNTFAINLHQIFRSILRGKLKPFQNSDRQCSS